MLTLRRTAYGTTSSAASENAARDARAPIGPEYAAAKAALPTDLDRKRFFDGILTRGLLTMLRDGRAADAQAMVTEECVRAGVRLADPVRPRADAQQSAIA